MTEEVVALVLLPIILSGGAVVVRRLWRRPAEETLPTDGLQTFGVGETGLVRALSAMPTTWGSFCLAYIAMLLDQFDRNFPSSWSSEFQNLVDVLFVAGFAGLILAVVVFCFSRPRFLVPPSLRAGPRSVMSQRQRD